MKRKNICLTTTLLFLIQFLGGKASAQDFINITTPETPPEWALLEREVIRANSAAIVEWADYYLDNRGYLLHVPRWGTLDGTDDAIEYAKSWTILYMLGGTDTVLSLFKKGLEGHYQQYAAVTTDCTDIAQNGCYYKEFMPMSDFMHQGEGMQGIIHQGLSDPTDLNMQKRYRRFAGLYMNEDPEAQNYDPVHKIIRSFWTGSKGPMLRDATVYDWTGDPTVGSFHLIHNLSGRRKMVRYEEEFPTVMHHMYYFPQSSRGDHPLNLISTQLALNAYMLEHEDKYRDWLIEYTSAWIQRAADNGGNFPTNVGLDGKPGDILDGKWYRGTYGWNFSYFNWRKNLHHENRMFNGLWPGLANGLMVTGDKMYIDAARRQMDNLYDNMKIINGRKMISKNYGMHIDRDEPLKYDVFDVKDSMLFIPEGQGVEGWYNWTTDLRMGECIDLYLWSMDPRDFERVSEHNWIRFIQGENPGYPVQELRSDLSHIRDQIKDMRNDPTTPDTRLADWPMLFEPTNVRNLVNLMMGGNLSGGRVWTFHCRVRYFDPENRRAGIPPDVAGLVTKMDGDITHLRLVNLNQVESRTVIIQTGAYGEHQCEWVKVDGKAYMVDKRYFTVQLGPGSGTELVIKAKRYANQPSLAFPWHGSRVPQAY